MNIAHPNNKPTFLTEPCIRTTRGSATLFTVFMVLMVMAILLAYSTRTHVVEQTLSAGDIHQKRAFQAAESGMKLAYEWLLANNVLISADVEDMLGSGVDGWLVAGSPRWKKCGDVDYSSDKSHPCWGDPNDARRDQNFFYFWNNSTELPIDTSLAEDTDTRVRVEALYCLLDLDPGVLSSLTSPILGCQTNPALVDGSKFLIRLLARGEADCSNGVCGAEALVGEQISNFNIAAQTRLPGVPLVFNKNFPSSGVAEVVSNPNGGGPGIPVSVWANHNSSCSGLPALTLEVNDFSTCSAAEWYGQALIPDGVACGLQSCECPIDPVIAPILNPLLNPVLDVLDGLGPDVVMDEVFPCDLFQYYFGMARSEYETLRDSITVIDDCSVLDENSAGVYWVTGEACVIGPNMTVGSVDAPVMLISAASLTQLESGAELYGALFLTNVEDSNAEFLTTGHATVFGSVIADGVRGDLNGTFQVVYNEDILVDVSASSGLGAITGTWTDFHKYWQ